MRAAGHGSGVLQECQLDLAIRSVMHSVDISGRVATWKEFRSVPARQLNRLTRSLATSAVDQA